MKFFQSFVFLKICCLMLFVIGYSQETKWKPVDPGGMGWLMFASIHPSSGHLYVSSDMSLSLLRSADQGENWEPIANPIPGTAYYVAGDPQDPTILYMNQIGVTPKSSGIWKSTDNGDTWVHIYPTEDFGISRSQSGVIDPTNSQIIYWTTSNMGVKRSTDGGYSWKDVSKGLPLQTIQHTYKHCHILEIDHTSPLKRRRIYYPTNAGLFRMEGPDGRWKLVPGLPDDVCSDIEICDGQKMYAAFPGKGLFKSENDGKNWKKLEDGLDGKTPFQVVATNHEPDIVYVATDRDEGIYGSQNGGDTFRLLTHRRFNARNNWKMNYRQHEAVSGQLMFVDPNDPFTLYLDYSKKTRDGGKIWQHYGTEEVRRDRWKGSGLTLLTDYRVVFDLNRPNIVWFGFSDTGLMLSEDRGESIINVISFHRGEVNQAAYWRDKLVRSSGSCVSMAVDPDLSTTIYASINGKNANDRSSVGGIIIKSVDGGWNWQPIYEKHGLDDGIIRSIVIDPSSPIDNRTVYVVSYANGVYKSENDGKSFFRITPLTLFDGNTRLMWLEMAPSDSKTLYLAVGGTDGLRPIYIGPKAYPALEPGQYGGVFKTTDSGKSWIKLNSTREIPSVQDIAIHPLNADIVYIAACHEDYLVQEGVGKNEWREGGVFKSNDGGLTWEMIFNPPEDDLRGRGEVEGICINPVAPEILYAAVKRYGVYRTLNGGKTWAPVGRESMVRMQRRYHSIDLNPHDPSEVWVAHFGNSFSRGIDFKAKDYMERKFRSSNFIRNPGFEVLDTYGFPIDWKREQPSPPDGEKPVISVSSEQKKSGKQSVRFFLSQTYMKAPSTIPAIREQLRLESEGKIPVKKRPVSSKSRKVTGETSSWIYQKINPYFTTLMRGRQVSIEMDVYISHRNLPTFWKRGSEAGEIPRDPPQVYITEVRDYNVHWLVAETSLEDTFQTPAEKKEGRWIHCKAIGSISDDAQWLRVTVTGVGEYSGPMDIYVDNISLFLVEENQ